MDRNRWEIVLTQLQARARGYLVRHEVHRALEDFEDIVKEIDGGLDHLQWVKTSFISMPHFTDTDGPVYQPSNSASHHPNPSPAVTDSSQSSSTPGCLLEEERGREGSVLLEKVVAERDVSPTKGYASLSVDCLPSSPVGEEEKESSVGDPEERLMENPDDSTSVWSSLEMDAHSSFSVKYPRPVGLAQEVPHTPEALRFYRNTLTMELLWLQQAIDSRKKYLMLKERLSIS